MRKTGKNTIKIKVVVGYVLVFLAIAASGIIAYKSYNKLLASVYSLSKPDHEIIRMNRILTNLSEAENHIRIYSLTKQQHHLNNYVGKVNAIQNELDSLKMLNSTEKLPDELIDSMSYLLEERSEKLDSFVKLKRAKDQIVFSQKALKELNRASDTLRQKVLTTTTTKTFLDTVATPVVVKEEKKRSFFGKLFGGKKVEERVDTHKTVIQRTEVVVDTSFVAQSDTLVESIKSILQDVRDEEIRNRQILSREELRLIDENSFILGKIKKILRRLEQDRLRQLSIKTDKARQIASNSIFTISIIIIIGIVLGALFIFFILNDITRSNYYRRELLIAKGKAEKLAKVKEEFLATMSHEIRTPLNAVIGFSTQLDKTELQQEQKTYLGAIRNASEHLLGLVNEILDLAKIEAGKLKIENRSFQPYSLINEVYEVLSVAAERKNLEFSSVFSGDHELFFLSDPFRLKQILLNLGSNAIKFTEKGSVKIKASIIEKEKSHLLQVNVEDTGIGIAEDKLETIFEDFSQADSFSARKYGGTGLGLSISRRLARLLGGDLKVESSIGNGSVFTMEVPLTVANEQGIEKQIAQLNHVPESIKGKRFLIADDDSYSLLLLKTIFAGWELNADFVENGKEAWRLMEQEEYDLVLTDIHMPDMSGLEFCRQLRALDDARKATIPVIALTANVRESDLERYLKTGMTDCLVKPFDEATLLGKISLALGEEIIVERAPDAEKVAQNKEVLYDLDEIRKFTEDDADLMGQVLQSFVYGAEENLGRMNKFLEERNYTQIGEVAHKMLSSLNQLKVHRVVPLLKELEDLLHKKENDTVDSERVDLLVKEVRKHTCEALTSLKQKQSEYGVS